MNKTLLEPWKKYIFNLDEVLGKMAEKPLVSVGIPPYPRIMPSLFLPKESYYLYCIKNSADISVLKQYANIVCLGEEDPALADKVQSTLYLLKNFKFHNFLKSLPKPYSLLFLQTTQPIVDYLHEAHIPWVGHDPKSFEQVVHKADFRKILKELQVECIPDWMVTVPQFINKEYDEIFSRWHSPFVCQPGDYEVSGSTYFVHNAEDFEVAKNVFMTEPKLQKVNEIRMSPFVTGEAVSMLGCVTHKGVLSGTLQLQFIDVPESLQGHTPTGAFFGHDWGYHPWPKEIEDQAQAVVEKVGNWLSARGYKGIFGIDFMYDAVNEKVYPLECNPRSTGAIPMYSEVNLVNGVPPIDFFTVAEFLNIKIDFDFDAVNQAWKQYTPASHISILPLGIETMKINLPAGVYEYNMESKNLQFVRPAAFLHELKPTEFILIDQVPMQNQVVVQNVPRLFKFIFPQSIAESTSKIKPEYAEIISGITNLLRQ